MDLSHGHYHWWQQLQQSLLRDVIRTQNVKLLSTQSPKKRLTPLSAL
jgi:hypothetical protein